ncbi:NAD(P)/FAD-dependent oxidoreductase [Microbacterium aoyamense]|uniref:NAD(P)/FAD-dependent oxidoreductase n=1 Tax=Microbacterium aoyamense TaxID=344166 RepID=A0ABP5B9C8_9MICO|nr:FAD-dependent oxidoreductase [Microbacterium aoyamense]
METWDAIVIGGGAAGLSAAQMLGRSRRRTLVIDAGSPRNRFAAHMHGVLGQDGTAPLDLVARGRAELEAYGVAWREASVLRVDAHAAGVAVTFDDGSVENARALVVATGLTDELPDVPGLAERWGTSVLHCPYCHGWEVRGRRLGVLMVSPHQVHQAQLVRQWSDDVVVFAAIPLDPAFEHRLRARGVEIVTDAVTALVGDGTALTGVALESGAVHPVDALFTMGAARPHDAFLAHLDLDRTETPVGSFLSVDATGRTSSPRIWAAGNVVNPMANVPLSMGAGALVGGAVNGALVEEDFDNAPAVYWEGRYADRLWSGTPNRTLVDVVEGLEPGRALDLGCGEGADTIWLAERGWDATGIDISASAIARARAATTRARFEVADLGSHRPAGDYDLVTASFFQSPVALDRARILRDAVARIAPGGRLLLISHAAPPPWSTHAHAHGGTFLSPGDELAALALDPSEWTTELAEVRHRPVTAPDGTPSTLDDTVVMVRRTPRP